MDREGLRPELVLCSPARRARETLEAILPALGSPDVAFEEALYGAEAGELLARLRRIPNTVGSAMLVGHNPALQELVLLLAAEGPERRRVEQKLPAGALAVLAVPAWAGLRPGSGSLERLALPREL
jgi:phosphohistidine phosphatase